MSKIRIAFMVVISALVLVTVVSFVYKRTMEVSSAAKPVVGVIPVHITIAKQGTLKVTAHYLGKAESAMTSELSARITAGILAVLKREGDTVNQGELLVELDDMTLHNKTRAAIAELRAAQGTLLAAESSYQTQKASFERNQSLYAQAAIALESLEHSKAATDITENQVTAAKERIQVCEENYQLSTKEQEYAKITAPFAGIVTRRLAEPGDLALPGKALLAIQAVNHGYKVTIAVPQDVATSIYPGTEAVLSDGVHQQLVSVNKVYPALAATNLATVEIKLLEIPWNLPFGSSIGVDIVSNNIEGIIVPTQALISNDKGNFVIVIDDNDLVHPMPVQIVGRNSEACAIRGIPVNSRVAVGQENRLLQLADGSKVMPILDGSEEI